MRVLQLAASTISLAKFALPLMQALQATGWEVEALGGMDGHEGTLTQAGVTVHPWHMGHSFNPLVIGKARRELRSFLQTHHYDVIHTHCSFGGIVANPVAYPRTKQLLYTQHGFFVHEGLSSLRRRVWLEIEKIGLRNAHKVICVSQAEKALALSLGVGGEGKFFCIPGAGVKTSEFQLGEQERAGKRQRLRAEWGIGEETPVLLTVSRLTWDKGYREMIEAVSRLKQRKLPFKLIAAGSGKDEEPIRAAIQRADVADQFILLGWRDDIIDLYAAADVFVFASHREGLPISPIEAMASGLPVVASSLPGCREELQDGEYGLLYPVSDATALTEALQRVLQENELRQSLAHKGPQRAREFDLRRVVDLQVGLYQQLAAGQ
ncbi:MAG: glycosyltransferase family 4 protein [Armatimonadota bacterium]